MLSVRTMGCTCRNEYDLRWNHSSDDRDYRWFLCLFSPKKSLLTVVLPLWYFACCLTVLVPLHTLGMWNVARVAPTIWTCLTSWVRIEWNADAMKTSVWKVGEGVVTK